MSENKIQIDNIDFWGEHEGNKGGMRIYWSGANGIGTLDIVKVDSYSEDDINGGTSNFMPVKLNCFTEYMDVNEDKSFVKGIMYELINMLNIVN